MLASPLRTVILSTVTLTSESLRVTGFIVPSTKTINLENGNTGSQALTSGVYSSFKGDMNFKSNIEFSGSADDIFIVQTTGSLSLATGTKVTLDGALAKNIFWQVEVGAGSHLEGVVTVILSSVTLTLGVKVFRITKSACLVHRVACLFRNHPRGVYRKE
jgi:hypothetical protein